MAQRKRFVDISQGMNKECNGNQLRNNRKRIYQELAFVDVVDIANLQLKLLVLNRDF